MTTESCSAPLYPNVESNWYPVQIAEINYENQTYLASVFENSEPGNLSYAVLLNTTTGQIVWHVHNNSLNCNDSTVAATSFQYLGNGMILAIGASQDIDSFTLLQLFNISANGTTSTCFVQESDGYNPSVVQFSVNGNNEFALFDSDNFEINVEFFYFNLTPVVNSTRQISNNSIGAWGPSATLLSNGEIAVVFTGNCVENDDSSCEIGLQQLFTNGTLYFPPIPSPGPAPSSGSLISVCIGLLSIIFAFIAL